MKKLRWLVSKADGFVYDGQHQGRVLFRIKREHLGYGLYKVNSSGGNSYVEDFMTSNAAKANANSMFASN